MARAIEGWERRIGRRLRLRDLDILLTVVRSGSMARAAQQLAVSQPAISKSITDLEHVLGVRLLDRSSRGVEPTLYGSALVRRGVAIFDELRQCVGEIEFLANPTMGDVRIGCPEGVAVTVLPAAIGQLSRTHPDIVLHVIPLNPLTADIRELRQRNVDFLVGRITQPFEEDDLSAEILFDDPLVVVAAAQSSWARRRKLELAELVGERWILPPSVGLGAPVSQAFRAKGLEPPRATVVSFSMFLREALLNTGDYLTVLPVSMLRFFAGKGAAKALPIELGASARPVAIVTLKDRMLSPVGQIVIDTLRSAVGSTGRSSSSATKRS